jgi:hypothetical protein
MAAISNGNLNVTPSEKLPEKDAQSVDNLTNQYLSSLNARELKAYYIAKDHLGMSFTMERSNGFKKWKKDLQSSAN